MAALLALEPGFRERRVRAQLSLLAVLTGPRVAPHVTNLDECMAHVIGSLKFRLLHSIGVERAATFADEILAESIGQDGPSMRRIMRIWDDTPPRDRQNGSSHPVIWKGADGLEVRFLVVEARAAGANGGMVFDWHPVDASSHANLERILEESSVNSSHASGEPMRQSLRP
jgi:hypothetical protein